MIEAHSGSIRDVCMQSDGRTLITCGTSKRAINPYDPKSPCHVRSPFSLLSLSNTSLISCFFMPHYSIVTMCRYVCTTCGCTEC